MNKNIKMITALALSVMLLTSCGVVESGYTGVKVVDGVVQDDTLSEGRYGDLGPRTSVVSVNNKRQTYVYQDKIYGESSDQTVVYAQGVSITYQITKEASVWLVKNIGYYFDETILPDVKVASAVKNAMANIETQNCTNRSYIEPAAKQEIQSAIDEYYYEGAVNIVDVSIEQMDYEDSYNEQIAKISALKKQQEAEAINNQMKIDAAKAEAEAEATKAEAAKKTAEANAEVAMIEAKSYAETKRIQAEADAEELKQIGEVLTDKYIEYEKYNKWDGKLPTHTNGQTYISVEEDK